MSIVRVSESTAFDSTAAADTGTGGTEPLRYLETASTSVTTGGTAHTKGSWVEFIASTTADANAVQVSTSTWSSGNDSATLLDIGIGAAASEVVLVPDIACGGANDGNNTGAVWTILIPIDIPAGTRVALRAQSVMTSRAITFKVTLLSGGLITGATTAVSIGTDTGTSAGVEVGTGWTEVVASLATDYRALVVCPSLSTTSATSTTTDLVIGTGAAASEVEVARLPVSTSILEYIGSGSYQWGWILTGMLTGIAAGTRIVAKRDTQAVDVSFIGVT